ncbi:MAG: peptide deformylase [Bacteroidota bacterium]
MVLPIIAYGHQGLREKTQEIGPDYPGLATLIENMFETMYHAQGVGLAAPQVNIPIRMFVIDGEPMDSSAEDEEESMLGFKGVFINPKMMGETGEKWSFEEGCLSIPDIREPIMRKKDIILKYYNKDFEEKMESFSGLKARIIQHEYDHLEGVLFTDYLSRMRKQLLKGRLGKISKGDIDTPYPMKFPERQIKA